VRLPLNSITIVISQNLKKYCLLVFVFVCIDQIVCGQEFRKWSTKEILEIKEREGINYVLKNIVREMPVYRIDKDVALNFAYDYEQLDDEGIQVSYLSRVGLFLQDDSLNKILVTRLFRYITDFTNKPDTIPLIKDNLFYAIAFQNQSSSIDALEKQFVFWKMLFDSFNPELTDDTLNLKNCEFNTFMTGWVLYKLKAKSAETVNNIVRYNKNLRVERIRPKVRYSNRVDSIKLKRNYNSLSEIDFQSDSSFAKVFSHLPASLKYTITLLYNSNTGIMTFESWFNWQDKNGNPYKRPYTGKTLKVELVKPNKVLITWLSGYIR
jgi:hypothetical protein